MSAYANSTATACGMSPAWWARSRSSRTGVLCIRWGVQPRFWVTLASGRLDDDVTGAFRFVQCGTGSVPVVDGLTAARQLIQATRHRAADPVHT